MPPRSHGAEIRRRRILQGLTIKEFAQTAGYTLTHISQVELGHRNAGPHCLRRLADLFECKVADLMTEEPRDEAAA